LTDVFRKFVNTLSILDVEPDVSLVELWRSTVWCRWCERSNPVELVKWSKTHEMRMPNHKFADTSGIEVNAMLDCEHMATFVTSASNLSAIRAQAA
jgi:hypothetical protein